MVIFDETIAHRLGLDSLVLKKFRPSRWLPGITVSNRIFPFIFIMDFAYAYIQLVWGTIMYVRP